MLDFNESNFNACAFNAEDECPFLPLEPFWVLFLNPETTDTLISSGTGARIPANLMFPNQEYRLERLELVICGIGPIEKKFVSITDFRTPAAIVFDALGG